MDSKEAIKKIFERKMTDAKDIIDEMLNAKLAENLGSLYEKLDPVGLDVVKAAVFTDFFDPLPEKGCQAKGPDRDEAGRYDLWCGQRPTGLQIYRCPNEDNERHGPNNVVEHLRAPHDSWKESDPLDRDGDDGELHECAINLLVPAQICQNNDANKTDGHRDQTR